MYIYYPKLNGLFSALYTPITLAIIRIIRAASSEKKAFEHANKKTKTKEKQQ